MSELNWAVYVPIFSGVAAAFVSGWFFVWRTKREFLKSVADADLKEKSDFRQDLREDAKALRDESARLRDEVHVVRERLLVCEAQCSECKREHEETQKRNIDLMHVVARLEMRIGDLEKRP